MLSKITLAAVLAITAITMSVPASAGNGRHLSQYCVPKDAENPDAHRLYCSGWKAPVRKDLSQFQHALA